MNASIRFDISFIVNLDNKDVCFALNEHADDAGGDVTHACVIEARERVHRTLTGLTTWDVDEINVRDIEVNERCQACEQNDGGDYTTRDGVSLCAGCVNRALALRIVRDVLDNVGDYDVPLARASLYLDDDDETNRASGMPYVDSLASAWDMMRGESYEGARAYVHDIMRVVVDATREPGSVR